MTSYSGYVFSLMIQTLSLPSIHLHIPGPNVWHLNLPLSEVPYTFPIVPTAQKFLALRKEVCSKDGELIVGHCQLRVCDQGSFLIILAGESRVGTK